MLPDITFSSDQQIRVSGAFFGCIAETSGSKHAISDFEKKKVAKERGNFILQNSFDYPTGEKLSEVVDRLLCLDIRFEDGKCCRGVQTRLSWSANGETDVRFLWKSIYIESINL